MVPIDTESLNRQVATSESLIKLGEVHHPFVPIISQLLETVKVAPEGRGCVRPDELYQKLLDIPEVDTATQRYNPDRYQNNKLRALSSLLNHIRDLDIAFLNNVSSIFTGQELEKLEKLQEKISHTDIEGVDDLLMILTVAETAVPNLIQDQEYVKNFQLPGPSTTGGADYGPATGNFGVNQWCVDFRQFKKSSDLITQLFKVCNHRG